MRNRPAHLPLVVAMLLPALPAIFLAWQAPQAAATQAASAQPASEVFQGTDLENFLREAKVTAKHRVSTGITVPDRVTLELNGVTHDALFKTIDEFRQGVTNFSTGKPEVDFQDSYKLEIAAYELDKLVGLEMVPATVERQIGNERGSLQYWVAAQMVDGRQLNETLRLERKIQPPDTGKWNDSMYRARMWDSLIYNVDRNGGNVLVSPDWRAILIDHSRTFRRFNDLVEQRGLTRFSRSLLAGFDKLDEKTLNEHLGRYLTSYQIKGILQRRDKIREMAKKAVEKNGEAKVLFE